MDKLTFLTCDQLYGRLFNSNGLDIIKKLGPLAAITDFSILLGGEVSKSDFSNEGKELKHRAGSYWTKTKFTDDDILIVKHIDCRGFYSDKSAHEIGARPALQYSSIADNVISKVRRPDGILEIEYGYYPQWAPSHDFQEELNFALGTELMKKSKDYITIFPVKPNEYDTEFKKQGYLIFEYKEKKYICVKANTYDEYFTLSNGTNYTRDEEIWIEISPIKWFVDEKADIAISKNILFAGIQFKKESYYDEDFSKTDINWFMNTYLINDLLKNTNIVQSANSQIKNTNIVQTSNRQTKEQLLEEIKVLKEKLEVATIRNRELEKENTNYKQRIRRIEDIIKE